MVLIWLALLSGCNRAPAPLPEGDPQRPDVIVLSVDTLRADHLGSYGYERDTSPFLDELATGGVRFASAWSPSSWTLPSHATMLSGTLPNRHGAIEDAHSVAPDVPWLPEQLDAAGYNTAAVVSTLFVSDRFGFERGFDHFHDFDIETERQNLSGEVNADDVFEHALEWARAQDPGKPVFLFLHLYDVHYAYDPPPPFDEKFDRKPQKGDLRYRNYAYYEKNPVSEDQMAHQVAQYDEEIAWVDHTFRSFVETWRDKRPAYVVVTSDHGEEFGERGSWGHAHTLYPEQLHVPWIVSGPGLSPRVVEDRVGLEDLAPTLAGLTGVGLDGADGVDRAAVLRGGENPTSDAVPGQYAETSRFRTLRYRWHAPPYDVYVDLKTRAVEVCDLSSDPGCTRPADLPPEQVDAMQNAMFAWLGEPWQAAGDVKVSSKGVFTVDGALRKGPLELSEGTSFGLHPADAVLQVGDTPYAALGGKRPGDDAPVRWSGTTGEAGQVELTDAERAQLEALGYVQ